MMKKLIRIYLLIIFLVSWVPAENILAQNIPNWFASPPPMDDYFTALASDWGNSEESAIKNSLEIAKFNLKRNLNIYLNQLTKQIESEVEFDLNNNVNSKIINLKQNIIKQIEPRIKLLRKRVYKYNTGYRAFVLIVLPINDVNREFIKYVKNDPILKARYLSSHYFQELEEEMTEQQPGPPQMNNLALNQENEEDQNYLDFRIKSLGMKLIENTKIKNLKIAVVDFVTLGGGISGLGKFVAENLSQILVERKDWQIIERRLLSKILQEQALSQSGIFDEKSLKKIARLSEADAICTGTISDLGDAIIINARLINVETGEILATAKEKIMKIDSVVRLMEIKF